MRIPKFKSFFDSDRDGIAPITLKMDNFKSWFNSARFLNMRPPRNWSITRTVGTEKIDLKFVAEVDEDNTLLVTICNMSDYEVCFEGTMRLQTSPTVSGTLLEGVGYIYLSLIPPNLFTFPILF